VRCSSYFVLLILFGLSLLSPSALAEIQRFRLDPNQSQIATKIKDPFGNLVNGMFRLRQGEALADIDRLAETASVSLVIDASSYNSRIGLRDQDVQEYYLEVKLYPVIRLDSIAIQTSERPHSFKEPWQITLKARLELHGAQREVIVPIRLLYLTNKIIAQGSFRLSLEDFNIAVPRLLFLKSGNQVEVDFSIVGERQP
jgi:polyisoprenoid-binding protein YceI